MSLSSQIFPPLSSMPLGAPKYYGGVVLVAVGSIGLKTYFENVVMKARINHKIERLFVTGGVAFLIGRFINFKGYSSGDPNKRQAGSFGVYALYSMLLATFVFGLQHFVASVR